MLHPWAGLIFFAAVWNMYVLGAADAPHRCGQGVVESGPLLQYESRRQDAAGGRYNAGQKFLFWGFFLEYRGVAGERRGAVVPGAHSRGIALLETIFPVVAHACGGRSSRLDLFLIHIYMGVFAERGLWLVIRAMFRSICTLHPAGMMRCRRIVYPRQMTIRTTGASDYDARMRRAARLSAEHLFATGSRFLQRHIAAFQKTLGPTSQLAVA